MEVKKAIMMVPTLVWVAAILHGFIAVGLGVFYLPAIRNLLSGIFLWGFGLPIPPIFALIWTLLILLNWQALV